MQAYFDSREAKFKSPFGAVKPFTAVNISIDIWNGIPEQAILIVKPEGEEESYINMEITARIGGYTASCVLKPSKAQLIWYAFEIQDLDGKTYYYGAQEGRTGGIGILTKSEGSYYQLTVSELEELPAWYKNAIVYQIFPDRFARDEEATNASLSLRLLGHEKGPKRQIVDWDFPLRYDRNEDNSIRTWDFYGGTLKGITQKLAYLKELGITCIYLNPIFEAASNHRYDTGDYERIDMLLGLEEDFKNLCSKAKEHGIYIILDGVFNHTGCDSKYFNKYGNYPDKGAYQNEDSPYYDWYTFTKDGYECWWGVNDLPAVSESNESYLNYIYNVVKKWLSLGAKGFRLDVADELPGDFIAGIRTALKEQDPEAVLLGEVWEDASNKISYGERREYFLGRELDCVMNYPFTDGLLNFLTGKISGDQFAETIASLLENYPAQAFAGNLNLLGSHDRMRVLTYLGGAPDKDTLSEKERGEYRLTSEQMRLAKTRFWLANVVQMTFLGVPSIYYGDEAGLTGFTDPYNRAPFPWGKEDADCQKIVRELVDLRKSHWLFTAGSLEPLYLGEKIFAYKRALAGESVVVLVNNDEFNWQQAYLPKTSERAFEILGHAYFEKRASDVYVSLPPLSAAIVYFGKDKSFGKIPLHGKGVLCHVTSLPSGIFDKDCLAFLDYLHKNNFAYWQILPLNPTDVSGSPYSGSSAFAGNLKLTGKDEADFLPDYASFVPDEAYAKFLTKNNYWLKTYAMYEALKKYYLDAHWWEWDAEHQTYSESLWENAALKKEADFQIYMQFSFDKLWQEIRMRAKELGIAIIGDLPMYVAADSCDCWAHKECFALEGGRIIKESGAPPDYFDPKGQLWGSPTFNWQEIARQDYAWWLDRFKRAFDLYDYVRMDHFRGFQAYWETKSGELPTTGKWVPGPGLALFKKAFEQFGPLPIIAEDLGKITPSVRLLLKACGFYGMNVMQFASPDVRYANYNPGTEIIAYTGTHDNPTILGWCYDSLVKEKQKKLRETEVALQSDELTQKLAEQEDSAELKNDVQAADLREAKVELQSAELTQTIAEPQVDAELMDEARRQAKDLLSKLWSCDAPIKIAPLQDLLGLGNEARMNTPGTVSGNWGWKADVSIFSREEK
ncbi:MAG: 4-alpha-glucanotransferase [Phascolarctobacterium sp.]|nr:4-alpha-glucanotransferase [Phascolarctobacterium sp.]